MLGKFSIAVAIAAVFALSASDLAVARPAGRGGHGNVGVHRNVNAHRNVNIHRNVNVSRNVRVGVGAGVVRPWVRRPYFGTVVGGVALGTLLTVSAVPPVPAPGLCWYWADPSQAQGYWDYCQ